MKELKLHLNFLDFTTVSKLLEIFNQESIVFSIDVLQHAKNGITIMGTPQITYVNTYDIAFSYEYADKITKALIYNGEEAELNLIEIINKKLVDLIRDNFDNVENKGE